MSASRGDHDLSRKTDQELEERYDVLEAWPSNYWDAVSNDPRCGCADVCEWDWLNFIEDELARREAVAA